MEENEPRETFELQESYANNTRFEASVWDLKILFGNLEQHTGKEHIHWKTAISLPWMQVKILSYFLRLNIAAHELTAGEIKVTPSVKPQPPEPASKDDPMGLQLYDVIRKVHGEVFGESK